MKMRINHALAALGEAVYEQHGEQSGPEELVRPIADHRSRLATLNADIRLLSQAQKGQFLTPKRLAIGAVAAASLLVLLIVYWAGSAVMGGGGGSPKQQNTKDLAALAKKCVGLADTNAEAAAALLAKKVRNSDDQEAILDVVAKMTQPDQEKFAKVWRFYSASEVAREQQTQSNWDVAGEQIRQDEQAEKERQHQERMKPTIIVVPKN